MITIVDAVMGTGKSTWVIDKVNNDPGKKYIILTPLLSEVTRYKEGISSAYNGKRSDVIALDEDILGTKTSRLKQAIDGGKTVVTTHNLFTQLDSDGFLKIKDQGDYELIIDETITLVEEQLISQDDFKMLEDTKKIQTVPTKIDGLFIVQPNVWGIDYRGSHRSFMDAAKGEHVFRVNKTTVVFVMPPEKFLVFNHVTIMTYLFEGSETYCWLQLHKQSFLHKELIRNGSGYKILTHDLKYSGSEFKSLIKIFDDVKLNDIGSKKIGQNNIPLSHSWFNSTGKKRKEEVDTLRRCTINFFKNKMRAKGADILWTCPKGKRDKVRDRYFDPAKIDTWLPYTTRATNDYRDRHVLAFLMNVFPRVSISSFFNQHGIIIDQEKAALSILIQWTWRSAIRVKEEIMIYLPSERMRGILKEWL